MFDISFFEIMIISIVTLIIVGPERLPQVARTVGHLMNKCRQFVYSVKTDIHNELRMEELKKMQNTMQESVQSIENSVRNEINEIRSAADSGANATPAEGETSPDTPTTPKSQTDSQPSSSETKSGQETLNNNNNASSPK